MRRKKILWNKHVQHQDRYHLLGVLIILTFARLLPILRSPLKTYGYDFGFYLHALGSPHPLGGIIQNWTGYNNFIFYFIRIFHISAEPALVLSYFAISILLGLCFYLFFSKIDKTAGIIAVILFALSTIQSEVYLAFLYKTVFASIFLLLAMKFLTEKKYWLFSISSLVVLFSHRTTAIIYLLTLVIYASYRQIIKKQYLLLIVEIFCFAFLAKALWPTINPMISNFLNYPNQEVVNGIFLQKGNFLFRHWLYLILASAGMIFYTKDGRHPIITVLFLVTASWIIFKLPFYNRIYIYLDFAVIIFAAYFLAGLAKIEKLKNLKYPILICILLIPMFYSVRFVLTWPPLIDVADLENIKSFNKNLENGFLLALDSRDVPWLLAYSKITVAGPGILDDRNTYQEWVDFWSGKNQKKFLDNYPKPLYLYQRDFEINDLSISRCLVKQGNSFYKYIC